MITLYAKADNGDICEFTMKSEYWALAAWSCLCASDEYTFEIISKQEYETLSKKDYQLSKRRAMSPIGSTKQVGWFFDRSGLSPAELIQDISANLK